MMSEKAGLIYRGFLILLFIAFRSIFYQFSENGRYTYHKDILESTTDKYVVDTRTGDMYGMSSGIAGHGYFYRIDLKAGKAWFKPPQVVEHLPETLEAPPPK